MIEAHKPHRGVSVLPLAVALSISMLGCGEGGRREVAGPTGAPTGTMAAPSGATAAPTELPSAAPTTQPAPTEPMPEPVRTEPASVPIVTASDRGVHLHTGNETKQISSEPAAVAYAVGTDVVVFQAARPRSDVFPRDAEESLHVWTAGEVQTLPAGQYVDRSLLDARLLNGRPTALVAERSGGGVPDDTFEELVRIDLGTLARTTVVRRPAWESSHSGARLLADGDVIGLFSTNTRLDLARWSAQEHDAEWSKKIGSDTLRSLTLWKGQPLLIDTAFRKERGRFLPAVTITSRDVSDGTAGPTESHDVSDPHEEIDTGLFCEDWAGPNELMCGRGGGRPVVVSTDDDTFTLLPAPRGAMPTTVRPDR